MSTGAHGEESTSGSWWTPLRALVVAALVAIAGVGAGLTYLYERTGAFWPEAIPPRVQYLGWDYTCMDLPGTAGLTGLTLQGHTIGGGRIYASPPIDSEPSAGWIIVTDGARREICLDGAPDQG